MTETLLQIIAFVVTVAVTFGVIAGVVFLRSKAREIDIRTEIERIYLEQPEDIKQMIDEAVRVGADFAESIDLDGQLQQFLDDAKDKGEVKLYEAIDAAAIYLETQLALRGYEIDIPEEFLKVAIQTHVFNNRDRYPSGDVQVTVLVEEKTEEVG